MQWFACATYRPVTTQYMQKSLTQNTGMYLVHLAGLQGPFLANLVEFRFTVGYLLNSFFGRLWCAKMKKRSKLLKPRAAAWSLARSSPSHSDSHGHSELSEPGPNRAGCRTRTAGRTSGPGLRVAGTRRVSATARGRPGPDHSGLVARARAGGSGWPRPAAAAAFESQPGLVAAAAAAAAVAADIGRR